MTTSSGWTSTSTADALEAAYPRVTADLRTGELATVSAHVWTDETSFNAAMRSNLGLLWPGTKGCVLATGNIAVLSDAPVWAVAETATHEFIHVATLAANPSISTCRAPVGSGLVDRDLWNGSRTGMVVAGVTVGRQMLEVLRQSPLTRVRPESGQQAGPAHPRFLYS